MNFRELIGKFMMKYVAGRRKVKVLPDKKHIACIGDSTTFGHGVMGKQELTWEYFLNEKLGNEYQVLNYGVNGRTLQSTGDFPYVNDEIYHQSLNCKADIYLIMLGTNDAKPPFWNKERFYKEYEKFIEGYLKNKGNPEVILLSPLCCFEVNGQVTFGISERNVCEIVEIVKEIAQRNALTYIDMYHFSENHPEWFMDGVHPNEEGNRAIGEYLAEYLDNNVYKRS